jgi:hypothetical protein
MMADFCRVGSLKYWTLRAKNENYKTAKGCARAYYYNELKQRDAHAECDKVYKVELVQLDEVVNRAKIGASDVICFNNDVANSQIEGLKSKLDVISEFSWDYRVNVDLPPK